MPSLPADLLSQLATNSGRADLDPAWPAGSLRLLDATDAWRWSIPEEYSGTAWPSSDLLAAYEDLAAACLTTAFILSQRDAALRRLVAFAPHRFADDLTRLAHGQGFTTIGLSQLTTSRQHQQSALVVTANGPDRYLLHGEIPWVTGADRAEFVVIGAKDRDGRQYLFALPTHHPGVSVDGPMSLMALAGSRTARIRLHQATLDARRLLIGPVTEIPALGRGGTGGLETSCLALGLARAALDYLRSEAERRPELVQVTQQLNGQFQTLRRSLHALAQGEPGDAATLRADATQLVQAATQIALVAAKGAGYVRGHPVERWVRQAHFFLVWSCPRAVQHHVIDAQLNLLCPAEG